MFKTFLFAAILVLGGVSAQIVKAADGSHKIRVLVGDSPITNFHISQRANLAMMSSPEVSKRLKAKLKSKSTQTRWKKFVTKRRPTSKAEVQKLQKIFVRQLQNEARSGVAAGIRKKVLDELIDERLMILEAKKNSIVVSESMVNKQINNIAKRNSKGNQSVEAASKAFYRTLASRGVGKATFRDKIRASIAWQQVVRKKFGRDVNFGDRDVEQQLGIDSNAEIDRKVEFNLRQIIIATPEKTDQAEAVKQYVQANSIRDRFSGCSNMRSLVAPYKTAKVINLGKKTLDQIPSPINLILSDMKAGQITPPQTTGKGIEMYAVCDRQQVAVNDEKRTKVLSELRQKAFQMRAKRYLKDIRADAHIEYRD